MSEHRSYAYQLEAQHRREQYLRRIRENTSRYYERFGALYHEMVARGYDQFIPSELQRAKGHLETIKNCLENDPERAQATSLELGAYISTLLDLAEETRREFEERERARQLRRVEERRKARSELETFLQDQADAIPDPAVRDFAWEAILELGKGIPGPDTALAGFDAAKQEIRSRVEEIISRAQTQASEWKARRTNELETRSQGRLLEIHREELARDAHENPAEIERLLASMGELQKRLEQGARLDADVFKKHVRESMEQADAAVTDERCRKEAVGAIMKSLESQDFVLVGKPRRQKDGNRDEVVIVARKPGGHQAEFKVALDGGLVYKFDGYEGKACKKDIERILPQLQEIYGIQLSKERVLWENPDRLGAASRPTGGERKEGSHGG